MVVGAATTGKAKEKTRAKLRYLRRKKERRKNNRKLEPGTGTLALSQEDRVTDEQISEVNEELHNDDRSKKRRKVTDENQGVEVRDGDMQMKESVKEREVSSRQSVQSPTLHASLPSFPLPTLPDAPSKSVLALQGLDPALIDAEIVHPTTLLSISREVDDDDAETGLSKKTRKRLHDLGITELFAVQTALLPFLLPVNSLQRSLYLPYNPPRDVCVSAPTGSGKTLAYVLPIIEILSSRLVTRLRALVVLPTRDLVTQVRETFEAVGKGYGLKIGTATGQHSFAIEQSQLIADKSSQLRGGSSKIDILVCTPGRLMDHLNGTPNFSLQHLRFLVIDEADRLLAQSFQDWLTHVLAATRLPRTDINDPSTPEIHASLSNLTTPSSFLPYPDAIAPAFHSFPDIHSLVKNRKESSCQKLLFSATLTRDPGKIAALELRDPKYFIVQENEQSNENAGFLAAVEKFSMPFSLKEHMIICESSQKPLVLFYLLETHHVTNALVFTKSAEATNRLVQLFNFFQEARYKDHGADNQQKIVVRAYSSDLGTSERKAILENFRAQETQILVCSDVISRGIDISHVSHVVSYDVPMDMRKYVHRVGRTARAGRAGDAWTLVEEQEARYFKAMLTAADHLERVKRTKFGKKELAPLEHYYAAALGHLKEIYTR